MKTRHLFLVMTLLAATGVALVSCGRNASENAPASDNTAPAAPAATPPAAPPPAAGPATTTNATTTTNAP